MLNNLKTKSIDSFQNLSFFEIVKIMKSSVAATIKVFFTHKLSFLAESDPITWHVQNILQAKQYSYGADLLSQFEKYHNF